MPTVEIPRSYEQSRKVVPVQRTQYCFTHKSKLEYVGMTHTNGTYAHQCAVCGETVVFWLPYISGQIAFQVEH